MASVDISNQAAAGIPTPSSGNTTLFVDTDKLLKSKDDTGTVVNYGASGSAITSLTGEVTATGPGAAAATVSNSAVTGKLLTGLTPVSGVLQATDSILQAFNKLAARSNDGWLATATDGTVTISADTTLVRDMYYEALTIDPGVILTTGGFRIHARTTITNNGIINRNGNDGIVNAAGAALAAGTLGASGAGGAGGAAAGTAGGGVTGLGGSGGAGGATGSAGGAAGAVTVITAANGGVEVLQAPRQAVVSRDLANTVIAGGGGGGGGAGDGTAGGGGGSGGGVIVCIARTIAGTGIWRANGGNGGTPAGGNRGGGAGGGGGVIVLVSENDTSALTCQVNGGLGSSGTGTGGTGNNGSVGRVYRVRF